MRPFIIALFCLFMYSVDAQFSIEGTVRNQDGESLIAASVFLMDTGYASLSDEEGNFTLKDIPAGEYRLKVSYVGYSSYENNISLDTDMRLDITLAGSKYSLDEIEIRANRLEENSPFSFTQLEKKQINIKNTAQDLPFLLDHQPSVVVNSDAGAGVGYTAMRIRGSDATRINVTINGVPLNDSESHGVFWVNLPDFSSSVDNIQLQRGVGPSTNGAASFGATVALNTNKVSQNAFVDISGSFGSFNTSRLSLQASTGLLNERWIIDARYSAINSDGYIDRASSELRSWFFSVARIDEKSSLRFNAFSGDERTYQAWWGVPEARLNNNEEALRDHYARNLGSIYQTREDSINLFDSDRRYNYYTYPNQVDDYGQSHFQVLWSRQMSDAWILNATAHYTRGRGFFEEFRVDDNFSFYGLGPFFNNEDEEIESSDLVRRRWLDNHFGGLILNNQLQLSSRMDILFGLSVNVYDGDHFGNVVFSERVQIEDPDFRYYESDAQKWDLNSYFKINYSLNNRLSLFADLQLRSIDYESFGTDNGGQIIQIDTSYRFFNPKLGLNYSLNASNDFYISLANASREPVRSDFIDAVGTRVPAPEHLWNLELGHRHRNQSWSFENNIYFMSYKDQLVLTGAVNDVGAAVRTNVDRSYRLGLESVFNYRFSRVFNWSANLAVSQNRISEFTEVVPDYLNGGAVTRRFENTDIAFSPWLVAGSTLDYSPLNALRFVLLSKYVSRQFIDNTGNDLRSIPAYFTTDLILSYRPEIQDFEELEIKFQLNNVFNTNYSANAYTYSYFFGEEITENFFYPMAGTNFILAASVRF